MNGIAQVLQNMDAVAVFLQSKARTGKNRDRAEEVWAAGDRAALTHAHLVTGT
jgi:hypothetical protein